MIILKIKISLSTVPTELHT